MRTLLYGAEADRLRAQIENYPDLSLVESDPEVVVCYGGDGTLLSAELRWPGVPKAPIRNSRRGNRCMAHPWPKVIERLGRGELVRTEYMKLECALHGNVGRDPQGALTAMNEFNVHNGRINSAVRFTMWLDEEPYESGAEIIGDGFVVSTPFGSTAYFNQITRGAFYAGLGVAFKNTSERTNHVIVPEDTVVRVVITRGPAILAFDNAAEHFDLTEGDELVLRKHPHPAVLLTWEPMSHPSDAF